MHRVKRLAATLLAVATPAAATITHVNFSGSGIVSNSYVGPYTGFPQPTPPLNGTPVSVSGTLDLGSGIADDFTGSFVFDDSLVYDGGQGFDWTVAGGGSKASTYGGADAAGFAYAYGNLVFMLGHLTEVFLYVDYDGDEHVLSTSTWRTAYSYANVDWSGRWALAVPEPATWALMIGGFGLVGTAARRRRATA